MQPCTRERRPIPPNTLWACVVIAVFAAVVAMAASIYGSDRRPVVHVYGFKGCPPCAVWKRDATRGDFPNVRFEYHDIGTPAGKTNHALARYRHKRETGRKVPTGFPQFTSGDSVLRAGYPGRQRKWLLGLGK